jgi:hypothetical protein
MADSSVAVTAGVGTSIDTRTEATNGNHRQVVVLGDPATNAGVAPVDATNGLAVQVIPALPAGTNAIGKLAANSGVDIGDVDVTSIAAGDNNIGNVDIASAIPAGTNLIGAVKRDVINYTAINKYYSATGATTDGIVWSPASGKKVALTDVTLSTSAAATVTLEWDLAGGDSAFMAWDLAANGGVSINAQTPWLSGENDADLIITTSAGNIKIACSGYEY